MNKKYLIVSILFFCFLPFVSSTYIIGYVNNASDGTSPENMTACVYPNEYCDIVGIYGSSANSNVYMIFYYGNGVIQVNISLSDDNYTSNTVERDIGSGSATYYMMDNLTLAKIAFPPIINLTYPSNNYWQDRVGLYLEADVTDDIKVENVSLFLDGNITQTNSKHINGSYAFYINNLFEGNHSWNILAYDNDSQSTQSETRYFMIDQYKPAVEFIFPEENEIYNYKPSILNFTATDTFLDTCWYAINNSVNVTTNCSENITGLSTDEGLNTWKIWANDTVGRIGNDIISFIVETIFPPRINLTYPDEQTFNLNYFYTEYPELNLNWTIFDLDLDECWYEYNETNTSITCGDNYTTFQTDDQTNITLWANDTLGAVNSSMANWNYNFFVENTTTFTDNCGDSEINWTDLPDGTYEYNVTTCNIYDYCNNTETRIVHLDTTYPLVSYAPNSDSENISVDFGIKDWIFVNVSVEELHEQYIRFVLWNSTDIIDETIYTNETHLINWTNLPESIYFYQVKVCDYSNNCNLTEIRNYGTEHTNISVQLNFTNQIAELGSEIIVNASNNLNMIYVDVNNSAYGTNYSSGLFKTGFELVIDYFDRMNFFNNTTEINLTNESTSNETFNIEMHKYDYVNSLIFDISGTGISNLIFYNPIDKSILEVIHGLLNESIIYVNDFFNPINQTNSYSNYTELNFDNMGNKLIYVPISDDSNLANFSFNLSSSEYGFEYEDSDFTDYDEVLSNATIFLGSILPKTSNYQNFEFETFDSALNTTYWDITPNFYDDGKDSSGVDEDFEQRITNTVSGGKLTMYSNLANNLDSDEHDSASLTNQLYISNNTYFNFWSNEDTQIKLDYDVLIDEEKTYDESQGYVSMYFSNSLIWKSLEMDVYDDSNAHAWSDGLTFNFTRDYVNDKIWLNITGVETAIFDYPPPCDRVTWVRDWTNGIQSLDYGSSECADATIPLNTSFIQGGFGYLDYPQFKITTYVRGKAKRSETTEVCTGIGWICIDEACKYISPCYAANNQGTCENPTYGYYNDSCDWQVSSTSTGTEDVTLNAHIYEINRTLGKQETSEHISNSIFDSASNINTMIAYYFGKGTGNTQISTDNGLHFQEILPEGTLMPILHPGKHVKWKAYFFEDNNYSYNLPIVTNVNFSSVKGFPSNVSIDIGNNGIRDYLINGELNGSYNFSLNNVNISNLLIKPAKSTLSNYLPISVYTESPGIINFTSVLASYNPNPIDFNSTIINNYLSLRNGTIPFTIGADYSGNNLIIDNLFIKYLGGNSTIPIIAHNADYSQSVTRNITYYFSQWDYAWGPEGVNWLFFPPKTNTDQNVVPYGQTNEVQILNLTNLGYGGKNATLSFYLNDSSECVTTTLSLDNNKSHGKVLNDSWVYFNNMSYLQTENIWMWEDINCSNTNIWMIKQGLLYPRLCVEDGICSERLV